MKKYRIRVGSPIWCIGVASLTAFTLACIYAPFVIARGVIL